MTAVAQGRGAYTPGSGACEVPSRLRVHRLVAPKPTERGVLYEREGEVFLLAWTRVRWAFAAEVGEARALAVDLVIGGGGPECVSCRVDDAAAADARRIAQAALLALGTEACDPGLRGLAEDGETGRHFAEMDVFGEAVLEAVRFLT
jgi:hypothetical protein